MTDHKGERPATRIVEAFGGDPDLLTRLSGGQDLSWRAGGIVLKPADPDDSISWLAGVLDQVPDGDEFRIAGPVAATDGRWNVDGWSATRWLEGTHVRGRWDDAVKVSSALHAALGDVRAEPLPAGGDPWSVGTRVAWGDEQLAAPVLPEVAALFEELAPLLDQPWTGPPAQIIHGDLGGNILYADGLPPAVIDVSPHFAPAPFADAIIVADGVAWEDAPIGLAERFAATRAAGAQLLARAAVFRIATMVQLVDDPERVGVEIAAYRPVIDVALDCGRSLP